MHMVSWRLTLESLQDCGGSADILVHASTLVIPYRLSTCLSSTVELNITCNVLLFLQRLKQNLRRFKRVPQGRKNSPREHLQLLRAPSITISQHKIYGTIASQYGSKGTSVKRARNTRKRHIDSDTRTVHIANIW